MMNKLMYLTVLFNGFILDFIFSAEDKTWVFAFSGNRKPLNFEDERVGVLNGFEVEVVKKVCQTANKTCATTISPYAECVRTIDNHFYPGRGIMSGWFDACPGYTITHDRINSMDFTLPYYKTHAKFAVAPGNPTNFTLEKLASSTLTHLSGSYTNEQCLGRLGYIVANVTISYSLPQARESILTGESDVLFSPRGRIPGLWVLRETLHCDLGGVGVMVKKGSELTRWWDEAFTAIYYNGEYEQICNKWRADYRNSIKCLDPRESDEFRAGGK
ncbi:hypothetical protein SNE40_012348 [Patella caerulea]|uniref:Solute-binding protein family 3/N-terminal domain-containing protein n=1 Tax=Patella caerulea TaxID=87958 RepID=A0AAN8PM95_PATCE